MARTLKSDKVLFGATMLLVCVSLVMVYSASAMQAEQEYGVQYYYLLKQAAWAAIGLVLLVAAMRVDYHRYRNPTFIWSVLGLVVVALLAVWLFSARNGSHRWIAVGGLSLQPSEFAKLVAIVFAAALLERRMHRINEVSYALVPIGIVTMGLATLVVLEPDFGTTVAIVLVVGAMVFVAGLSYRYLFGAALILLPTAIVFVATSAYRRQRVMTWLDPWSVQYDAGFQIVQSLVAVGSGGALGRGLMAGVQKLYYLPEPHTDFIYSVIGEEFGLLGTTIVLICFAVICWRGLRASLVAPDRFGALLGLGLTMMVGLQAMLNMSVVIGLLPTKGIPLPLVSSGGSSLVANLIGMGILLNISQQSSPSAAAHGVGVTVRAGGA
jgi:cell division protein FtsW